MKTKQKTIPLFDGETPEKEFELSYKFLTESERRFKEDCIKRIVKIKPSSNLLRPETWGNSIYIRKDEDGVFIHVGGLNFLMDNSGTMFRFFDKPCSDNKMSCDVVVPELAQMPLFRIKEFVARVLENNEKGLYKWNYTNRAKVFELNPANISEEVSL